MMGLDHMSQEPFMQFSRYDGLTGLPNRLFFNEVLNKALSYAKRHDKTLSVLIVDLVGFKKINQEFGHAAGDVVLKELGKRFEKALRAEDVLAKLDGDEYVVLLSDIDKAKFASTVAEKLLRACSQAIEVDGHPMSVTASIGIAVFPTDGDNLDDLLTHADAALYRAKNAGEGIYQYYAQEMNVEAREFIQMGIALREALERNELRLYYQPKLHIKQGKVASVEALVRWAHPKLGILMPDKFIPIAEETGLIMKIGEWILREVCRINKFWQTEGYSHISVSVNLSPKQFYNPGLVPVIDSILKETQLNPNYLELEINESTVMNEIGLASQILEKIKRLGVVISLDHFGAGYTSISHLKNLPVSIVKIDPSFIRGTPHNPNDMAIIAAFIGLAHNLGMEIVAEGVETSEQVVYLTAQQCDYIQGYFLSHPVPADKIVVHFKKLAEEVII